jgi:hypothetical protein
MRSSSPFAVRGSGSELDGLANYKIASFNTAQRSGLIRRPAKLIFFAKSLFRVPGWLFNSRAPFGDTFNTEH